MKPLTIVVALWLVVGAIAGLQRHYYSGAVTCAKASTVAVTIVAGPLNYVGANPRLHCAVPHPSK
jgi:hypothetical protein